MANLLSRERSGDRGTLLTRPFGDFLSDPFRTFFSPLSSFSGIDISRAESGYVVEIPVAGFKPEDVEVTLEDNVLTVNGKSEKRSFTRSLVVPEDVDSEKIEANVEHGMLTLNLTLQPKARPKKIEVKRS